MNVPEDIPSPESASCSMHAGASKTAVFIAEASRTIGRRLPRFSALRRRRLQLARYLRLVASLQDEADEMRAEISSLEFIIGAQADAIEALRRQNNGPAK